MKHKKIGFLHFMCGKQGHKGKRKLSVDLEYRSTDEEYLFAFALRLIFFFVGVAIEIEKKKGEDLNAEQTVSQETAYNGSV